MIKRIVPAAILGIAAISITACSNNNTWKKTADGLEYQILKDEKNGKSPTENDVVTLKVAMYYSEKGKKDTLLIDYAKMNGGQPIEMPASFPGAPKNEWPHGLRLMTPGDSAIFRTSVDSLMKTAQGDLPPFMKKGGYVITSVVLVGVKSQAEMQQAQQQQSAGQMQADDKILQDYFSKNGLTPQKTASGLYYIIEKEGTGATIAAGQQATVNYTGKMLDGRIFDSNVDPQFQHVEPMTLPVGQGQVIPGWDEGLQLLKKGTKAKLFIPSPLAYGPQERGDVIKANSILMFDIEVLDVKNGAPAANQ
jgi:FKBP-type peptidyl-prolyl cis-trans isomerase